jgi:hypothetical protein
VKVEVEKKVKNRGLRGYCVKVKGIVELYYFGSFSRRNGVRNKSVVLRQCVSKVKSVERMCTPLGIYMKLQRELIASALFTTRYGDHLIAEKLTTLRMKSSLELHVPRSGRSFLALAAGVKDEELRDDLAPSAPFSWSSTSGSLLATSAIMRPQALKAQRVAGAELLLLS